MNLNAVNRAVTLLSRLFDPAKPTQAFLQPTAGKPEFPENPAPFFPRVSPEMLGMSGGAIASFLRALDENPALHMHGVTILHRGCIVCEAAFGAQDLRIPKYTFSACKSIVSLCIGILIGDGKLALSDKLVDLFPERINAVSKMRLSGMCVRDLLTMRSGIVFNELECQTDEDWIRCFLGSAVSGEIGTTFSYNSLNTYMLSAIICKKTGMPLSAFAEKRLFAPLAITDYFWETCPAGIEKGGWGLYLRQEDLAKLGTLVLYEGRFPTDIRSAAVSDSHMCIDTRQMCNVIQSCMDAAPQIVPQAYIRDAVTPHAKAPAECGEFDYGYQIWVGRETLGHARLFNGMLGQNVLIFPDTDTVIVSNAGNDELFQTSPYYRIARDYFSQPSSAAFRCAADADSGDPQELQRTCILLREHTSAELHACSTPPRSPAPAVPQKQPAPRGFLDGLRTLFGEKKKTEQPTAAVPTSAAPAPSMPEESLPFLERTFSAARDAAAEGRGNAVGLLPVILQALHNAYTGGFVSVSLSGAVSDNRPQLLVTYREQNDTHVFPASIRRTADPREGHSIRSTCTFRGIPFRIAASCRFTTDEDNRPVCILHIHFLETPCSRTVKLFLNSAPHTADTPDAVLYQEETPGDGLIARELVSRKVQFAAQPIIGGALGIIDDDYLFYRTKRIFAPELGLYLQ